MSAGISDYRRGLAFAAGVKARNSGKPRASCNRERCTIYYDDWQDGWGEADQRSPTSIEQEPSA